MDQPRDLARNDLWEQSLERSRARREAARTGSQAQGDAAPRPPLARREAGPKLSRAQRKAARNKVLAQPAAAPRRSRERPELAPPRSRERRGRRRLGRRRLLPAGGTFLALIVLVAVVAAGSSGSRAPRLAAHVQTSPPAQGGPTYANAGGIPAVSRALLVLPGRASTPRSCEPIVGSSNYFNPLAAAHVTPERIDQGVDYAGSGTLGAIGAARITYVGMAGTGWPGDFIEYRLLDGTDAGCYVYYAEGVKPATGLRTGQIVGPGQPVATIIPSWSTGIEIGWGAGYKTVTYAAARHQWSAHSDEDSIASGAGKSFSALIAALGGPPGKLEG